MGCRPQTGRTDLLEPAAVRGDVQLLLLALHREARECEVVLAADQAAQSAGLARVEDPQARAVALAPNEPLGARGLELASAAEQRAVGS